MAVTIYKNVRFANRIDFASKWREEGPELASGEIAFVSDNGKYYMVVGCEDGTNMAEILDHLDDHASHIFYPGPGSPGGGGGSIPPATASTIGGVKVGFWQESGLLLEDGVLTNALVHDYKGDRFIINKLHVNDLSFDRQTENVSSTGNYITVRADKGAGMGAKEVAGLIVNNIDGNGKQGFLGINLNNQIVIKDLPQNVDVPGVIVAVDPDDGGTGYIDAKAGAPYANIIPFGSLTFEKNKTEIAKYTPESNVSIDLTPPGIRVNGQLTSYDMENNEYNIALEGGLTEENAANLEQFDNYIGIINDLNAKHINAVEGDGVYISAEIVKNGEFGKKIIVTHNDITPEKDIGGDVDYPIQSKNDQTRERLTVITGIEVDDKGHVTKIVSKDIAWTI